MPATQPDPSPSGADLARQALADYKAKSWAIPGTRPSKPKPTRTRRTGNGRDPIAVGAAFANLIPDFAAGINGGSILARWPELCPQYIDTVQPVAYDIQRGRLDLRPCSPAYGAQLRLLGGQLAKQINDKLGHDAVKSVRVLPPGNLAAPAASGPDQTGKAPAGEPKTRETAHPGYRAALAAHEQARPEHGPTDPYLIEAIARQDAALRAHRLPDDSVVTELEAVDEAQARHAHSEASLRAALAYKRSQQKNGPAPVRRAFDVA